MGTRGWADWEVDSELLRSCFSSSVRRPTAPVSQQDRRAACYLRSFSLIHDMLCWSHLPMTLLHVKQNACVWEVQDEMRQNTMSHFAMTLGWNCLPVQRLKLNTCEVQYGKLGGLYRYNCIWSTYWRMAAWRGNVCLIAKHHLGRN